MLTTNIDIVDRLINGQLGTILRIDVSQRTQKSTIIYIKFGDSKAGKNLTRKLNYNQVAKKIVLYHLNQYQRDLTKTRKAIITRLSESFKFPITLAWACTVHKVQGLTLDKIVVSLSVDGQKYFNYGQIYVAISQYKTLEGIHMLGEIEKKHVRVNWKVLLTNERL